MRDHHAFEIPSQDSFEGFDDIERETRPRSFDARTEMCPSVRESTLSGR